MIERFGRDQATFYTDYEIENSDKKCLTYAPYYIRENLFSDKQVDTLKEMLSEEYDGNLKKGSVIGLDEKQSEYNKIRDSSIAFLGNNYKYKEYDKIVTDATEEVNKNVFNLDLTCYMNPQYTTYGVGQYFEWHPDGPFAVMDTRGLNCIPKDLNWRKLSLSIMLSDDTDYDGGDFSIMLNSAKPDACINTIRMSKGTGIFFPAFATHRVAPVTRGTRKTLIYWFCGPRWR